MDSEETVVIENRLQDESPTEEMVSFTLQDGQFTSMNIEYPCLFTPNMICTQSEGTRQTLTFAILFYTMSLGKNEDIDARLRHLETKSAARYMRTRELMHRTGNQIVEKCFGRCVESMRSKKLGEGEIACVENCTTKYLDLTNRMYARFQEIQKYELLEELNA